MQNGHQNVRNIQKLHFGNNLDTKIEKKIAFSVRIPVHEYMNISQYRVLHIFKILKILNRGDIQTSRL